MVAVLRIPLSIFFKMRNSICTILQICKNLLSQKTQVTQEHVCHNYLMGPLQCHKYYSAPYLVTNLTIDFTQPWNR